MASMYDLLRDRFGFDSFRPGQEEVIKHLLAGQSAAAVFPTGSGKSLCYQLPALIFPGLTLVVSPLLALMKEQIDRLKSRAIAAERLDSTLSLDETGAVMDQLRSGKLKLLYVAPERFKNERFAAAIRRVRVSLLAVDEAHCISEWGHNFRPDYLKLANFARLCAAERTLALTATATPQVLGDICKGFGIAPGCSVRTGFYRDNLTVMTTPVRESDRFHSLLQRLQDRPSVPAIVYVTLQKTAEEVAGRLADAGLPAKPYHAGMETPERTAVQEWFAAADHAVVAATIAFGMGIDKRNIRAVYHYNVPKSLENFSQEIGRAGRDGLPSTCEMFVCPDDLNALENFVYGDTPSPPAVNGLVRDVLGLGQEFDVSLRELADKFDIRVSVVNTLLAYLELDGYLEGGAPFFARYQFRPLVPSAEILKHFDGERREFLTKLFRQAVKARVWLTLDVEKAVRATGATRDRVVRAMDYLADKRWIEVQTGEMRNRFRRLQTAADLDSLAAALHHRTLEREQREITRLRQVLELAGHDGCQVSRLGEHFGEPLARPCGHCSWCLAGGKPVRLPPRRKAAIDEAVWHRALSLRRQQPALAEPRALARFLCGLGSPVLLRNKFNRDELFGALAYVPFPDVLRRAEAVPSA